MEEIIENLPISGVSCKFRVKYSKNMLNVVEL